MSGRVVSGPTEVVLGALRTPHNKHACLAPCCHNQAAQPLERRLASNRKLETAKDSVRFQKFFFPIVTLDNPRLFGKFGAQKKGQKLDLIWQHLEVKVKSQRKNRCYNLEPRSPHHTSFIPTR